MRHELINNFELIELTTRITIGLNENLKPTSLKAHILFDIKATHAQLVNIFSQKQIGSHTQATSHKLSHHLKNNNTYIYKSKKFFCY